MVTWRASLILTGVAAVVLMRMSAGAQQIPGLVTPLAACGPNATQFRTTHVEKGDATAPESANKATVYVIELYDARRGRVIGRPPTRVGMDGAWMGATEEFSFLKFSAEPGTRHLCARANGGGRIGPRDVSLFNFDAEAGKTYYLRMTIVAASGPDFAIDLQPLSADEGHFLVTATARSVSQLK